MPFVTKAQIENARQPDLLTFLRRYRPDELVPAGSGAFKLKSHDSLKISNGKWCWWSHDRMGGVNALEYLIKVEHMKFPEAVQLINEQCGFSSFSARQVQGSKRERPADVPLERDEFLLPVRNADNRRVTAYLLSRGIDMEILDFCFQNRLLYEDAAHHNAVFVGYDGDTPRYATLRGATTGNHFMREVAGSSKAYCFSISAAKPDAPLNVFECAIDALSYLTMVRLQGGGWRAQSVLSLGGVYRQRQDEKPELPVALKAYLDRHPATWQIILRLDSDDVGRGAAQAIWKAAKNCDVSIEHPAQGKDYNEWLMCSKGLASRQRTEAAPER